MESMRWSDGGKPFMASGVAVGFFRPKSSQWVPSMKNMWVDVKGFTGWTKHYDWKLWWFCEVLCLIFCLLPSFSKKWWLVNCDVVLDTVWILDMLPRKNVIIFEVLQTCLLSQRRQETFEGLLLCTPSGVMNKAGLLEGHVAKEMWAMKKRHCCLEYIVDYITQLCGEYSKPL